MTKMLLHFLSVLLGILAILVLIEPHDQSGLFMNFSIAALCHIFVTSNYFCS